jgi:hypothetical protein
MGCGSHSRREISTRDRRPGSWRRCATIGLARREVGSRDARVICPTLLHGSRLLPRLATVLPKLARAPAVGAPTKRPHPLRPWPAQLPAHTACLHCLAAGFWCAGLCGPFPVLAPPFPILVPSRGHYALLPSASEDVDRQNGARKHSGPFRTHVRLPVAGVASRTPGKALSRASEAVYPRTSTARDDGAIYRDALS